MFGFPIGNGNSGAPDFLEKFTNNADSGFPNIQQREVFYSVRDGNWTDVSIWETASGRVGKIPTEIDDVYIRHNVTNNNSSTAYATASKVYNLFITNTLNLTSGGIFFIHNNINCQGLLNITSSANVYLIGENNVIKNFNVGTSTIVYASATNCNILELPYYNLMIGDFNFGVTFGRVGIKYLTNNLTVTSSLVIRAGVLEVGSYDLTVNGATALSASGGFISKLSKLSGGNLTFVGNLLTNAGGSSFFSLDFSGNPNVEFRAGLNMNGMLGNPLNSGTGTFRFTTNNQSIGFTTGATSVSFNCVFQIENINLSFGAGPGGTASFNNVINGTTPTSTFTNRQVINLVNTTAASGFMTTGIADLTSFANTVQYFANYSVTLPPHITTYSSLTIGGTGTKTLGVNTTLNGILDVGNSSIFQLSNYNLSVIGASTVNNSGQLLKSGVGSVLFTGLLTNRDSSITNLAAATSIEFKGGITSTFNSQILTGTNQIKLSGNQTITIGGQTVIFHDVLISGAFTVINATASNTAIQINNSLNGDNVASTWDNRGPLNINTTSTLMSTGVIIWDVNINSTMVYIMSGNYTLPYTSYQNLTVSGGSTKSLSGNTSVRNLIANAATTFQLSTYNLTVNGAAAVSSVGGSGASIVKSGAGSVLFVGAVSVGDNTSINFSTGNPNVEMRGGISNTTSGSTFNFGTGQLTFTTNNQSINSNGSGWTLGNTLISGAITITFGGGSQIVINGVLNGDNAASKWLMGASSNVSYRNATQPMVTGLLDTSTNLNTWIYGLNNQDIKGGPTTLAKQVYRNLTLNGTGVKTLQGYVSVLNTYTLTAPATLALNGFTLTNP